MLLYTRAVPEQLALYDTIPMLVDIRSVFTVKPVNRGLGGLLLQETPVPPRSKDLGAFERMAELPMRFDLTNWAFFLAFDGDRPAAGAAVASRTCGVNMLEGREDLSVLWDLRVSPAYQRQGIGTRLFALAADWSREQGLTEMKIECQNNNAAAVKFYHRQGAVLGGLHTRAYFSEPTCREEVQLLWHLPLQPSDADSGYSPLRR